jgi:thiol peroxidase
MSERTGECTFQGNPLTLVGPHLAPGDTAPDFTLIANNMSQVSLKDSAGKVRLLSVVPSLDTPVCDMEVRKFNTEIGKFGDQVTALAISADLPFAQARWCGAAGATNVQTLSDHFALAFGDAYGTRIKEWRLNSRAVFVVDASDKITYSEYVKEVASEPDYEAALAAVKAALA